MLLALFAGVFRYVDQHFHTPETFLENTSELATNADIRERLFDGFRTEIIALADGDIEEEAETGLGDLLDDDLPDPITEEQIARDQAIEEVLLDVFDSPAYDQAFANALSRSHNELIASAELEPEALLRNKGEIFFNMQPLYDPIYRGLAANPATIEITQTAPPAGHGVFKVADRETTVNFLWTLLRNGPNWRGLTMLGAIASLAGAVAVADRRPSTAIQFGGGMVGVGVVLVVIIYLIRFVVPLLAGGGSSASPVVAVYAANLAPLVSIMIRMVILGAVLAAIGGVAKLIWPDDWVYSSVSDERGIRSVRRRRGAPEAEQAPQQQLQPAAMVPGYGGYPQPYAGYPPQHWGQPYAGQYPPGYQVPYPAGPYAQPAQPLPQHYTSPGKPTVPVMPVQIEQSAGGELIPPAAPPLDPGDLPPDAAQVVPRVVATADATLHDASPNTAPPAATPPTEAPASAAPTSAAPPTAAPPTAAPASAAPTSSAPPTAAPPTAAPASAAPTSSAPPTAAPTSAAPPTAAPPTATPPTAAPSSATPPTAAPPTAAPASAAPAGATPSGAASRAPVSKAKETIVVPDIVIPTLADVGTFTGATDAGAATGDAAGTDSDGDTTEQADGWSGEKDW